MDFLLLTSLKVKAQIWLWKKPSSLFRDEFKLSRILILPVTLISPYYTLKALVQI